MCVQPRCRGCSQSRWQFRLPGMSPVLRKKEWVAYFRPWWSFYTDYSANDSYLLSFCVLRSLRMPRMQPTVRKTPKSTATPWPAKMNNAGVLISIRSFFFDVFELILSQKTQKAIKTYRPSFWRRLVCLVFQMTQSYVKFDSSSLLPRFRKELSSQIIRGLKITGQVNIASCI